VNNNLKAALERNITKLNWMGFVSGTQFHLVIFTLFILSKGFTLQQFFLIEAAGALVVLLCQLPTGAYSDKISRKWALVISSLIITPLIPVIILSHSFWAVLIAMGIGGIGQAFASGADIALLYDTSKALGRQDQFKKINGTFKWYGALSGAIGGIVGGILAQFNMSYAWWAYFLASIIVLVVQLTLVAPEKESIQATTYRQHYKNSFKIAFKGNAAYFVFFSATTWLFFSLAFWLWQPYMKAISIPILFFGIVYAILNLVSGFVAKQSHIIEKKVGMLISLMMIPLILALAFVFQSLMIGIFGVVFLLIHTAISGYQAPVLEDYLNSRVPSENRATVLSIKNMINNALFLVLSPMLGHLVDLYSLHVAYLLMAAILVIMAIIFWKTFDSRTTTEGIK